MLPPNRLRLFNPAQALQAFISQQLLSPGWSGRINAIEALLRGPATRRAFRSFFQTLLPRVLALLFMLPALALVADLAGLLGGGLMAWYTLGISPGMFRTRLLDTDVSHFLVGIAKAPFFALIIGVIGCFQGLQVEGNAESLGRLTSRAVVQAIFMVILADATFSILFAAAGV